MSELTHRKVERRAGMAQGSVKYYFGSRQALVGSVLTHLTGADLPLTMEVSSQERERALRTGDTRTLLEEAQSVADAVLARPEEARARFHLYLAAAGDPSLQPLVHAARDAFVERIARSLPGPGAEAGARFVCAVLDGILLDQLSAPSPVVHAHVARYVLAAGAAGADLAAAT